MKRNAILFVTFGLILIVVGILFMYLNGSFNKNKDLNNKKELLDLYNKFEQYQEIATGERSIITNEVVNNYFDEMVEDNYDNWITKLKEYETKIRIIEKYGHAINSYCIGKEYKDTEIKSACESMIIGYETQINYFVKDIDNFNKFISDYNENYPDKVKKQYELSYRYIDVNDDGKYLGK